MWRMGQAVVNGRPAQGGRGFRHQIGSYMSCPRHCHHCHPEPGRLPLANGGEGSAFASAPCLAATNRSIVSLTRQDLPIKHMRKLLKTIDGGVAHPAGKAVSRPALVIPNPVACLWRTVVRDLLLLCNWHSVFQLEFRYSKVRRPANLAHA
jgi:hypothetical protein